VEKVKAHVLLLDGNVRGGRFVVKEAEEAALQT
jgi:hypothetical protein